MNRNFQKELDKIIEKHLMEDQVPTLLLHSCCAPCSSYCLEYLGEFFRITVFYYNPNIYPPTEFDKRSGEQRELIERLAVKYPIDFVVGAYDQDLFYESIKGNEADSEGGERCFKCYELRLRETAIFAAKQGYDYVTTSLSISPMKNVGKLTEIGEALAEEFQIEYLPSDFKKKGGYQRSVELSGEYGLYRQNYCGCVFSMRDFTKINE